MSDPQTTQLATLGHATTNSAPGPVHRSTVAATRNGFHRLLRAEWTKFRSVRSTAWCVLAAIGLTVLVSYLISSSSSTNANDGPHFVGQFSFVHQPMVGDGTIVAR